MRGVKITLKRSGETEGACNASLQPAGSALLMQACVERIAAPDRGQAGLNDLWITLRVMENRAIGAEERIRKAGQAVKWAFVIFLAAVAGIIALLQLFRTHPAQEVLVKAVKSVQEGDIEGAMEYVDPQGQLGVIWRENVGGARDALASLVGRYRLEFSSLKYKTRVEGDFAEVQLVGGRVTVYAKNEGGLLAFFDLEGSDLVFYLQKKDGSWLIEGTNYDLLETLSGSLDWLYEMR